MADRDEEMAREIATNFVAVKSYRRAKETIATALRQAREEGRPKWQTIDTLPNVDAGSGERFRCLLWSEQLGICSGEAGNYRGHLFANVSSFHGNAIEHWGVTHWMPFPTPPGDDK